MYVILCLIQRSRGRSAHLQSPNPQNIQIYTMPSRTPDTLLGQTAVPGMELRAHGEGYTTEADFRIKDVGHVKVCGFG